MILNVSACGENTTSVSYNSANDSNMNDDNMNNDNMNDDNMNDDNVNDGDEISDEKRQPYFLTCADVGIKRYAEQEVGYDKIEEELERLRIEEAIRNSDGTIEGTYSWASIQADMSLTGSGTGYHAKLVICTPTSAVSFGIQFDEWAARPYTGKTMALLENIGSNNPGGQTYVRPGNVELQLGETYHMMVTLNKDGTGAVYLNCQKLGDYYNPGLANQGIVYLRVEGSGRKEGDSVYATFHNIKLKTNGTYYAGKEWGTYEFQNCQTISSAAYSQSEVSIGGYISGIGDGDWDSRYNEVSGIIQFIQ